MTRKHSHYFKNVEGLEQIDVYRVLQLFAVTDPCIQHAVKKLLVPGQRGHKDVEKDVREAILSCERFLEMVQEDALRISYPLLEEVIIVDPPLPQGDLFR
jgi:hypothetical protein